MSDLPNYGLHVEVPEAVYESWPAARASVLKRFDRSAAHARQQMLHPKAPTAALELGRAVHLAILEPNRFGLEYVAAPKVDRRTTAGKAQWSAFEAANANSTLMAQDAYDECAAMRDAVWAHPLAQSILSSEGMREVSALWEDDKTGTPCKARVDALVRWSGRSLVVDVKTTKDASPNGFGREAVRYGYDLQLAFYRRGLNTLSPAKRGAVIVAVEKEPPYCVCVYAVPDIVLELGERKADQYLDAYQLAMKSGVWPGYPNELTTLELPNWAFLQETDDE